MANVDRPNGFRPVKSLLSAPWNALIRTYEAGDRSSDTTNNHGDIYIGDPVKITSGKIFPANSNDTVAGVVVGVGKKPSGMHGDAGAFDPDNLMKRYLAYNEDGVVLIVPVEGVLFEAQTDADLDLVPGSAADFGTDAGEAHGSRTTGQSIAEIITVTNSDLRVVEDSTEPDNVTTAAYARHLVMFLKPQHVL